MSIQFQCDACGKSLKTDESKAGRRVKCPGCSEVLTIPEPEPNFGDGTDYMSQDEDEENPFKAPKSSDQSGGRRKQSNKKYTLADPGRRLISAFLDALVAFAFFLPAFGVIFVGEMIDDRHPGPSGEMLIIFMILMLQGLIALAGVNIYLLATRAQSVAKYLLRIQILDYETNEPASFAKCAILRSFVNGLIGAIPLVGALYTLVDVLFIFTAEHRCLHDQLAGTYVVNLN